MRKLLGTCLLLFGLTGFGLVPQAQAQQDDDSRVARQVEALSAKGAASFRADDYEAAIGYFEEAYDLHAVPNLLFNIGRCYEQMEEWDQAIAHFERFITAPDVESEARQHAMERVQSLREIREATARGERPEPVDDEPKLEDPGLGAAEAPNRVPGFAAIGAGAALLGGGVAMGLTARGSATRISDTSLDYDDRLAARGAARTQGIVADVLYVSGAAAVGVGVYLLVTAGSGDAPPQAARIIQPWIGRDGAGIGFHFGF